MNHADAKHLQSIDDAEDAKRPRLENWWIENWGGGPGDDHARGNVYNHPRFFSGEPIYTSRVKWIAPPLLQTLNTLYQLGKPAPSVTLPMSSSGSIK